MSMDERPSEEVPRRLGVMTRLRNYFLTGLVIAAPISITIYLTWSFIQWVDGWIKPLIPAGYTPDNYLPFSVPGFGLIVALIGITLLGFLTANLVGRTLVAYGELMVDRTPLVRNVYRALKQIFETVLSNRGRSFQKAGLIEFPHPGSWSIVFIATETTGEIKHRLSHDGEPWLTVFLPPTPAPTAGFLMFVPKSQVIELDMTVEEAARMVISAGLVTPEYDPNAVREPPAARRGRRRAAEPVSLP